MSQLLLFALVAVAALACPAHMWWMHRQGKRAACCPRPAGDATDPASLREHQRQIEAQLAELDLAPLTPPKRR